MSEDLAQRSITTIRTLSIDGVQRANSGHPGMPMGMAPVAYLLFREVMAYDPAEPAWPDRDRFVLSAGHGSMLLYSALHLAGFERPTLDDLKAFRQWGSVTPGHPESHELRGVETTTGPLGQGVANGIGMAVAAERLAAEFNRPGHDLIDHRIYGIVSDGDLMEGVASEAASLAGHLRLGRLTYFYDDNRITIDGSTDKAFSEDVLARFDAYGWHTQQVEDGNDLDALRAAIAAADDDPRPSLIAVRTTIGYGAPNKAGTPGSTARRSATTRSRRPRSTTAGPTTSRSPCPTTSASTSTPASAARRPGPTGTSGWPPTARRTPTSRRSSSAGSCAWSCPTGGPTRCRS
jgi:transketolase